MMFLAIALITGACRREPPRNPTALNTKTIISRTPLIEDSSTLVAVRFLEDRVKADPDDLVALNKLAGYYLKLHRETEDVHYLELAMRSAKASLAVLPADQNLGGLSVLAQVELETHNFTSARDHARELTEYQPHKSFAYQVLGDALLELGDYENAAAAYKKMQLADPDSVGTNARLARQAFLHGDQKQARQHYIIALSRARESSIPSPETIAWCHWQLGELAFALGRLDEARNHYDDAWAAFVGYPHAATSLARLLAAQGDLFGAIWSYELIITKRSDPIDSAALGDLYKVAGRNEDAEKQYRMAETVSQGDALNAALYNRHLVLFWADHDRNVQQAYEKARNDYTTRRDIFGADAFAWAAFKAGKIEEARGAMQDALRLGTQDARLFYHAGIIARAAGDTAASRNYLRRSLELNPHFDPVQASIAKSALDQ
jgi:tetratricopeptide (TPR) repeat protein